MCEFLVQLYLVPKLRGMKRARDYSEAPAVRTVGAYIVRLCIGCMTESNYEMFINQSQNAHRT